MDKPILGGGAPAHTATHLQVLSKCKTKGSTPIQEVVTYGLGEETSYSTEGMLMVLVKDGARLLSTKFLSPPSFNVAYTK